VGDSILSRQLQQEIGKQGFSVSQLDASFDKQGVFSSRSGAFSVEIAETQVRALRHPLVISSDCLLSHAVSRFVLLCASL